MAVTWVAVALAGLAVAGPVTGWPPHRGDGAVSPSTTEDRRDDLLGLAGGELPSGTDASDDLPGVVGLEPRLLDALRRATAAAAADGVVLEVNSGWRSAALQEQLLREAAVRYGSREEAARWVATPATSAHVRGEAVDVGPWDATAWLSEHGADLGLCQVYANESWHYELRPGAVDAGCPPMWADPTEDPGMQQ